MRIIETTVYKFSELSPEAKEKAIESFRYINVEDTEWYVFTFEGWYELLESYGFIAPEIYFSGFWSQGDGACFDARIDIKRAFKEYVTEQLLAHNPVKHKKWIFDYIDNYCSVSIKKINYHYSHENTRRIDYSLDDYPHINKSAENFFQWLESRRHDLCCKIYKSLEENYNYLTSDEAVIESIEANDYEFTSEGKMV